jgi:mannose-6-phosphate isomerase-like protein (cupin superfamily)
MTYINQYNPDNQFSTTERCDINELFNHTDDAHCSIARALVAPGVCTQLHAVKNTVERYVILEGHGKVTINNSAPEQVSHLDIVTIPSGVSQKIENCGDTALIFLCICTPRFEQKNYLNLEEETVNHENI